MELKLGVELKLGAGALKLGAGELKDGAGTLDEAAGADAPPREPDWTASTCVARFSAMTPAKAIVALVCRSRRNVEMHSSANDRRITLYCLINLLIGL